MTIILAAVAWLLTYLVHSTVLILGALALTALGIVRSHAARDTLWKVALVGGLLTTTAQLALSVRPWAGHLALDSQPASELVDVAGVRDVPVTPRSSGLAEPAAAAFAGAIAAEPPAGQPETTRAVRSFVRDLHISWPALILNLWFVTALGFGSRLLWTRFSLAGALRDRRDVEDEALLDELAALAVSAGVRPPRLTTSEYLSGPIAFGHEICLPERVITRLTRCEQRAVLAHELGHVVRRDPAWLMVALAIESVFFVQPLNRLARRRLRAASEYLCDDWAAERTGGIVLARCLAEVAGWVQARPAPAVVAGMAGHCSHLVSRVERLLDGSRPVPPARWVVRAASGLLALTLIAWTVPGVAAEDIDDAPLAADDSELADTSFDWKDGSAKFASYEEGDQTWGRIRDGGHVLVFSSGFSARLRGQGRLGVRQWGRALELTDGYAFMIDGQTVGEDVELCGETVVRIIELGGSGAWELRPVPIEPSRSTLTWRSSQQRELSRAARDLDRASAELGAQVGRVTATAIQTASRQLERVAADLESDAATDQALGGEADAAIDTLLQLWIRDPETVRRAARRIVRTYDRDLRPQFESLGVEMGRELAPQLQRLTDRLGRRDLSPEFARLGAELGLSIVSALGESAESGAGHGDYRGKTKPKE